MAITNELEKCSEMKYDGVNTIVLKWRAMVQFEKELLTFEKNKAAWLMSRAHKFVWIHDSESEFFDSFEDAVSAAYSRGFEDKPIFVKEILEKEAPFMVPLHLLSGLK